MARRLLTLQIPLSYVLLVAALVGAVFVVVLVAREPVDLGRAVDDAVEASVSLSVCNETVDRREINPRTAELDLQEGLEDLGVKQAKVTLTRLDCGPDGP